MLSRRPLPPALGHQALLRVRLAPPHVLWAGRRCGDSSLPAAGPSRTQCPLQHPCSTPAPSPRVSGLQVLGSSTSILKAKVEAKFASSQGCPQGPGLFVENPVPEAQPTCALGCDARRPGRSNRRRAWLAAGGPAAGRGRGLWAWRPWAMGLEAGRGRGGLGPRAPGLSPSWVAGPAGAGCFGNRPVWPGTWGGCLEPGSLEISS